jgi:hypothetical protein
MLNDMSQPESAEHVLHIHAQLCEAIGRAGEARAAIARAYGEVQTKLGRLRDSGLRERYRSSSMPRSIIRAHARLHGSS